MKKCVLSIFTLLLAAFVVTPLFALPNPAAVYCNKLGYEYKIIKTSEGERGVCVVKDMEKVFEFDAWEFFRGKVGKEYSYCAKNGYDTESEQKDEGGFFTECAVCVSKTKSTDGKAIEQIPMIDLMEKNGEPLLKSESSNADTNKGGSDCKDCQKPKEEKSDTCPNIEGKENKQGRTQTSITFPKTALPDSFDWRSYNGHSYVNAIRDQSTCGSCYAFGAVASAEGVYNYAMGLYDGARAQFSESFVMWCLGRLPEYGYPADPHFYGCDGADYDYQELEALTTYGVCSLANFPYTMTDPGSCTHWSDPLTVFSSWGRITCSDIDAIKTAIMTYGVIDVAVDADWFEWYGSGIYNDGMTACSSSPCYYTSTNHAVALVGWDDTPPEGGGGCWILRNSWGSSWGESGYMRIRYTAARVACEATYLTSAAVPLPANFSPQEWFNSSAWNVDNSRYVVGGDFNGDSRDDVAVMYDYSGNDMGIWVFTSNADNTFTASAWYTSPSWNVDNTRYVVSGDFNWDGKDDLAAMYDYGNHEMGIWVFAANADNTFSPSAWYTTPYWNVDNTKYVVSGDFNGDRLDDLAAMYDYGSHEMGIWVFAANAGNTFSPLPWYTTPSWDVDNTKYVVSGDFNGDDKDDLAAMYDYGNHEMGIWVFAANAGNTFAPLPWYTTPSWNVDNTKFVVSGDYDGDGYDDIGAIYDYDYNEMGVWVFAANAGNTFAPTLQYSSTSWNVDNTIFATNGDFDNDGKDDIGTMYDYGSSTMALWIFISLI